MYDFGDMPPSGDWKQVPQGGILKTVAKVSNWQTYVIYGLLAVIVALGGIAIWQRGTVAKYKVDVVQMEKAMLQCQTERDIANSNEASCRVNLKQQNDSIGDAGKRYKDLQAEFDQLQKDIKDGKYYKKADDVKNQPVPKNCEETLDFLNRNFP